MIIKITTIEEIEERKIKYMGVYQDFFNQQNMDIPYKDDQEFINEILSLVDMYLNIAFQVKGDFDDQMDMRGIVITPVECEYALNHRKRKKEEEKAREQSSRDYYANEIKKGWNYLIQRKQVGYQQGKTYRIWNLIAQYQLNQFEMLCFFLALAVEFDRKYERLYGYLQDNIAERMPTIGLGISLYELGGEKKNIWIGQESMLYQEILEKKEENKDVSRLAYPMRLQESCLTYIRTGNRTDTMMSSVNFAASIMPLIYNWQDLIVEEEQKDILKHICGRIKYKKQIQEKWGFGKKDSYGNGTSAVFYGPAGTGKTMAAQVIAAALDMELYRVDISMILSKYIGETEKNLKEIFDKMDEAKTILLFDEADGLFAKRSDISNSNDRYANMQTGYLLQKFEEYSGLSILTTNFVKNMDEAFKRRFTFMVKFRLPDETTRCQLWKSCMPKDAQVDEELDFEYFAHELEIAGSGIKEIVTNSAYLAAEQETGINNALICQAINLYCMKYDLLQKKMIYS